MRFEKVEMRLRPSRMHRPIARSDHDNDRLGRQERTVGFGSVRVERECSPDAHDLSKYALRDAGIPKL